MRLLRAYPPLARLSGPAGTARFEWELHLIMGYDLALRRLSGARHWSMQ